ncbi:LCP family protein [Patescibacteria group bacterium]|nr:LCP family protein [Patescibacteria group bacterium]MBP9709800.1 LCP family protein [Patescibacteria group bacterium]
MFEPQDPPLAANFVEAPQERRIHRQTYIIGGVFALLVAVVSGLGAYASYRSVQRGTSVLGEVGAVPVIADIRRLMFGQDSNASAEQPAKSDRMNVLLFGVGGEGHDGPQLTDTIILASIDLKDKKVAMLSIPRDTAYPLGGGRFEKINSVQAYAEQEHPGEGARVAADALGKLLEVKIDHVVRIDFSGFAKFIDAIGGVDVNVERAFTDPQYPTEDEGWMTVSFKKGTQHFSGTQALTYARSRHGNNGEGSDFARSRRQQLLMLAVREKLLSLQTLSNPSKLSALYSVVSSHLQTDFTLWDFLQIAPLAKEFSRDQMSMRVLTDAPDGELVAANVAGAFMLFPKEPDWSQIREIAQNPFVTSTQVQVATTDKKTTPEQETVKLEVKNGTARTGFASQVAAKLERSGYEIMAFGNAVRRGYERTVVYDLTNGKKPAQLSVLRRLLQADVSTITPTPDPADPKRPKILLNDGLAPERLSAPNVDFLIILGEASDAFINPSYASSSSTRP